MLQEYEGALSFAIDAWTSPNHRAFVAVTVHFQQDGELVCLILDVVEVAMSHSGANLAVAFAKILEEFGVFDKVSLHQIAVDRILTCSQILCITCDNASSNDTMIEALSDLIPLFPGDPNCARCFNHVIALIAKSLIHQFDVPMSYPILRTCFPVPIVTICSLCVSHFSRISLSNPMHRSNMVRCMDPILCTYPVRSNPIQSMISFVIPFLFI
jgi:hypothetical protein